MPTSDFLAFATGGSANVIGQSTYAASSTVVNGFQSGICPSAYYNKALRQANFITAALAQWLVSKGYNVTDDGNLTNITNNMIAAWAPSSFTASSIDTLTNKSISGSANTITNISFSSSVTGNVPLTSRVSGVLPIANGGMNLSSVLLSGSIVGSNGTGYFARDPANINSQTNLTGGSAGSPTALTTGLNVAVNANSTNEYILPVGNSSGTGSDFSFVKNSVSPAPGGIIIHPPSTGAGHINGSSSTITIADGGGVIFFCIGAGDWISFPGSGGLYT